MNSVVLKVLCGEDPVVVRRYVAHWRPKLIDLREGSQPNFDKATLDGAREFFASRHGSGFYPMLRKAQ